MDYRRMGNMEQHLGNTTSTTFLHQSRDLWKSPKGTVLRIEALALLAIFINFLVVVFGSCRRWSNRWIVQKGFLAANVLSLSLGTYSIGIMQSSSVKSEMYPIWAVSLFTLFGCVDSVTTYSGLDYKGPLLKMLFQLCLYCGYVLLMSISSISTAVGNTAIGILSAITFIKGFHRSLALVLQCTMRNMLECTADRGGAFVLAHESDYTDHNEIRQSMFVDWPLDVNESLHTQEDGERWNAVSMADIDLCREQDELRSCYSACAAFCLSHMLHRYFLGMQAVQNFHWGLQDAILLDNMDYKWALKVISIELTFLYDVFYTGNAFIHYYQAKTASFWALASLVGICFVGAVAVIPRTMNTTSRDPGTIIVEATTRDLYITLVILVTLALLQLMHLIRCWTSNWARVAFACEYARKKKRTMSWWMRLKAFVVTRRTTWFDNHIWQNKLGQYSLVGTQSSWRECKLFSSRMTSRDGRPQGKCASFLQMLGLQYMGQVLWDLLGSNTNKGTAARFDDDVKASIADFLGQIKSDRIEDHWVSLLTQNGIPLDQLPYVQVAKKEPFLTFETHYTTSVMTWYAATCYCELAEQEQEKQDALLKQSKEEEEHIGCRGAAAAAAGILKKAAAAAVACFTKKSAATGRVGGRGEAEKNRHVAITLSRYCAYLLVSAPELLFGPSTVTVGEFGSDLREALSRNKDRPLEAFETEEAIFCLSGVGLGKHLLGKEPYTPGAKHCSDTWRVLAHLWVHLLLYAAPYGPAEAHMRHLSQGGELITHLWALLYHLNILGWEPGRIDLNAHVGATEGQERDQGGNYRGEPDEETSEDRGQTEEKEILDDESGSSVTMSFMGSPDGHGSTHRLTSPGEPGS